MAETSAKTSNKDRGYAKLIRNAALIGALSIAGLSGCGGSSMTSANNGAQVSSSASLSQDQVKELLDARKAVAASRAILVGRFMGDGSNFGGLMLPVFPPTLRDCDTETIGDISTYLKKQDSKTADNLQQDAQYGMLAWSEAIMNDQAFWNYWKTTKKEKNPKEWMDNTLQVTSYMLYAAERMADVVNDSATKAKASSDLDSVNSQLPAKLRLENDY